MTCRPHKFVKKMGNYSRGTLVKGGINQGNTVCNLMVHHGKFLFSIRFVYTSTYLDLIEDIFFCLFDGSFLLFKGKYSPWKIELIYHKVCSTYNFLTAFLTIWSFEKIQLIFDMENWLWKYDFGTFWWTVIHRRSFKKTSFE